MPNDQALPDNRIPFDALAQAVLVRFHSRPTLVSVARDVFSEALKSEYPALDIDLSKISLKTSAQEALSVQILDEDLPQAQALPEALPVQHKKPAVKPAKKSSKRVFKSRNQETLVGDFSVQQAGQAQEVSMSDPLGGKPINYYKAEGREDWQVRLEPPVPSVKPDLGLLHRSTAKGQRLLEGVDAFIEYAILDEKKINAKGQKEVLWYAHFHCPAKSTGVINKGHLKLKALRYKTYQDQLNEARNGEQVRAIKAGDISQKFADQYFFKTGN